MARLAEHSDGARAAPAWLQRLPGVAWIARWSKSLGPGLITGASDDDPSGIVTYSIAGASFGYSTLWTALISFPLMAGVQLICARIGLVYGCGLAAVMRKSFPKKLVYLAIISLVTAN